MPIANKEKYNAYMKAYRRNKKLGLPPDNKTINILDRTSRLGNKKRKNK